MVFFDSRSEIFDSFETTVPVDLAWLCASERGGFSSEKKKREESEVGGGHTNSGSVICFYVNIGASGGYAPSPAVLRMI